MSNSDSNTWPPASGELTPLQPGNVNLTEVVAQDLVRDVVCFIEAGENEYDGQLGARISALFVVLVVSSAVTFFPVLATRSKKIKIPLYVYLFARYFGAGVIVATAFIHLLDPAYSEIGPNTCVGMTGGWAEYSWVPALALTSGMFVFLMDFGAERYVEKKYGLAHGTPSDLERIGSHRGSVDAATLRYQTGRQNSTHQQLHSGDQDPKRIEAGSSTDNINKPNDNIESLSLDEKYQDELADRSFKQQISAFLILEFGIIFHSVIIGLTLGSAASSEFSVLYPVIVFHQSFEGLGLGARLSAIPFPKRLNWLPYTLCAGYGLTTPIAIAVGLGIRTTYNESSMAANIVSGVLDSISAGILLYTGFVELLARDFLFNPERTKDDRQLAFMVGSVLLGAGVMALLGKWA
ncbi:hypothetical protein CKM354_000858100 [Cercospora kikuchii]|uniref:Zinc-regulated transporter 1 n=1 Tax=Cercospora kikuchii TaxID=84275 RepID=A0A9P3CJ65_9PEZI|nr:uncharacterized protein CKM354_000858100 [Cercospora kikuchii]GIZ45414.1 hypothetical protein CKM354_000858100 [Cercospora kikuchii]